MFTDVAFWKSAGERAIKTVAQTAAATLGAVGLSVMKVDVVGVVVTSLFAGVLSILTSVANYKGMSK